MDFSCNFPGLSRTFSGFSLGLKNLIPCVPQAYFSEHFFDVLHDFSATIFFCGHTFENPLNTTTIEALLEQFYLTDLLSRVHDRLGT